MRIFRAGLPFAILRRFAWSIKIGSVSIGLENEPDAEQIKQAFVLDGKRFNDGIAKTAVTWPDGLISVEDKLQVLLRAADVEAVVTQNRFELRAPNMGNATPRGALEGSPGNPRSRTRQRSSGCCALENAK